MKHIFRVLAILVVGGFFAARLRAAQQIFWPIDQFPPPTWRFASTNDAATAFNLPGQPPVLLRRFSLTNLVPSIMPPLLGSNAVASIPNPLSQYEASYDVGANWTNVFAPGFGMTLQLSHTNDSGASRIFDLELTALNIPLVPFVAAPLRQSQFQRSPGQMTITTTNGGFLISGFIQVSLEIGYGAGWFPASTPTYLELSGPPGIPALMSIAPPVSGNIQLCWTTQNNAHYQVQQNSTLGSLNWTNIGVPVPGNGSNVCASVPFTGVTNQFYRVQLSP